MGSMSLIQGNMRKALLEVKPLYKVQKEIYCSEYSSIFECTNNMDNIVYVYVVMGIPMSRDESGETIYKNNVREDLKKCERIFREEYGLLDTFSMRTVDVEQYKYYAEDKKEYFFFEIQEIELSPYRVIHTSQEMVVNKRGKIMNKVLAAVCGTIFLVSAFFAVLFFLGDSTRSIGIHAMPEQIWYVGDTFPKEAISLKVVDYLGRERIIDDGFELNPSQFNSPGFQKIVIEYDNKTTTLMLNVLESNQTITAEVKPEPEETEQPPVNPEEEKTEPEKAATQVSVSVRSEPSKTTYFVNETLNTSGLSLTAKYSDGTSKTITDGFTCSPTQLTSAGNQRITVTYGGQTAAFDVKVDVVTLRSVALKNTPSKTTYFVNETLSTSGLSLTAKYSDGTSKTITDGFTCSPTLLTSAGNQRITVTYEGQTVTFDVKVEAVTLSSVTLKNTPSKTTYFVNETLNTSGLSLTAKYSDGTSKTITDGFTCSPTQLTSAGNQRITVTYGGQTAAFDVKVDAVTLSSVALKNTPSKTTYFVNETLNTIGLSLTAKYSDGTSKTITDGFTCSPTLLTSAGNQRITVTYGGQTAAFDVKVDAVTLSSIALKNTPSKTTYFVNETLNTSGLSLTAKYSDGTSKTITDGFTCSPTLLTSAGNQRITVTYGGQTASFDVMVDKIIPIQLSILNLPTKMAYTLGDAVDTTGLLLRVTYNNGTENTISEGFLCSPMVLNSSGTQTISLEYNGISAEFSVSVQKPESSWEDSGSDDGFTNPFQDMEKDVFVEPDDYQAPAELEDYLAAVLPDPVAEIDIGWDPVAYITANCDGTVWWYFSNTEEDVTRDDYVQKFHDSCVVGYPAATVDVSQGETFQLNFDENKFDYKYVYVAFQAEQDLNFGYAKISRVSWSFSSSPDEVLPNEAIPDSIGLSNLT